MVMTHPLGCGQQYSEVLSTSYKPVKNYWHWLTFQQCAYVCTVTLTFEIWPSWPRSWTIVWDIIQIQSTGKKSWPIMCALWAWPWRYDLWLRSEHNLWSWITNVWDFIQIQYGWKVTIQTQILALCALWH